MACAQFTKTKIPFLPLYICHVCPRDQDDENLDEKNSKSKRIEEIDYL